MESTSSDSPALLTARPILTLGGKETPEESFYRVAAANVGTNGNGDLYVLDRDAFQVHVFDSAGAHLRSVGRQGSGPGELQFPLAIAAAQGGDLWVLDAGNRTLSHWGPEGELLEPGPYPEAYRGGGIRAVAQGLVIPFRDDGAHRLVIVTEAGRTQVLAELALAETRSLDLRSCGMRFRGLEPLFSPALVWAAWDDTVVVAKNPAYVVDVYVDGRLVRSVRRRIPLRQASAELAQASLGAGMRVGTPQGERVCDPAEVVEQQGFAAYLPMIDRVALAPDGTLWVQRYSVDENERPIDIFNPAGEYLATLPDGTGFPVGFLPNGRILLSERDELDVERLVVVAGSVAR